MWDAVHGAVTGALRDSEGEAGVGAATAVRTIDEAIAVLDLAIFRDAVTSAC
jgi:hypothetical protein